MAFPKMKTAPSPYPRILFHTLQAVQAVSSAVVLGITSYFVFHLRDNNEVVPGLFIALLAVSVCAVLLLGASIFIYLPTTASTGHNILINGLLTILLSFTFSWLTHSIKDTITQTCTIENWISETGMGVCRLYKVLFSFAIIALVSTLFALSLDVYTHQRTTSSGKYSKTRGPLSTRSRKYQGLEDDNNDGELQSLSLAARTPGYSSGMPYGYSEDSELRGLTQSTNYKSPGLSPFFSPGLSEGYSSQGGEAELRSLGRASSRLKPRRDSF